MSRILARLGVSGTLSLLVLLALAIHGGLLLSSVVSTSDRLPLWDMAKIATSGQRLVVALTELAPLELVAAFNDLSVWPPLYPLLELPVFALFGFDYRVPRLLQVVMWMSVVVTTWWALRPLCGSDQEAQPWGDIAGIWTASLFAISPFFAGYATLNMLELPSLLMLTLCLGAYGRALGAENEGDGRSFTWWRATWLASLGLFLCKYNYGLLWMVPVLLNEGRRLEGSWGQLALCRARELRRVLWWWPGGPLLLAILLLALAIRWTGGFMFELAGMPIRMTSLGGPAYFGWMLISWRLWALRKRSTSDLKKLDAEGASRSFWLYFLAPAGLWMLIPPHLKDFIGFVENRSDGPELGSWDWLTFYPRLLPDVFGTAVSIVVVSLAGLGLFMASRREEPLQRLVWISLSTWGVALLLHPYKLPRFAFSGFWWLAVASALGLLAARRFFSQRRWYRAFGVVVLMSFSGVATGIAGLDRDRMAAAHEQRTVEPEVALALEVLSDLERRRGGLAVLGTWNRLSPHLVEWHSRRADAARAKRYKERGSPPLPVSDLMLSRRHSSRLLRQLEDSSLETIVVLDYPGNAAWQQETKWLEPIRAWLPNSGVFELSERQEVGGYTLLFWRRAGT